MATDITTALAQPGCERLREWVSIGPVQMAALQEFVGALLWPKPVSAAFMGVNPRTGTLEFCAHQPSPSVMRDFNMQPLYSAPAAPTPDYRGYANLGIGQYVLNHSAAGEPPEVIISIATEEEKAGRAIGEERDNPPGHMLQPDAMAVRLRFASPAGLAALENEIRKMRETHGWAAAPAAPAPEPSAAQVPLTRKRINKCSADAQAAFCASATGTYEEAFAREVEKAHGIAASKRGEA